MPTNVLLLLLTNRFLLIWIASYSFDSSTKAHTHSIYLLGWTKIIKFFAKICPIYKFQTVLNSWDRPTSKLFKTFLCKTLFKGRAFHLKIETLHIFTLPQKRTLYLKYISFAVIYYHFTAKENISKIYCSLLE